MSIFKKLFGNRQNDMKEVITMTNTQKALELINTFATGDTEKAASLLAEGYIQHNLAYGTGRDAFVGSVAYLASAPVKTTVNNIRAFEDGDKVFLQTVYNFAGAGEQVAFDIFRFDENGKIAEHWDNLAAKAEPNPSGRTQIDGTNEIRPRLTVNLSRTSSTMLCRVSVPKRHRIILTATATFSTIPALPTVFPDSVLHLRLLPNRIFR